MAPQTNRFVTIKHDPASKVSAKKRVQDFHEIIKPLDSKKAAGQSSRCAQCGVPFCQSACPLHNNIPDWLAMMAEGKEKEAWELSAQTSTMPEICGRICPQDRLCEGLCVLEQSQWGHVTIGSIEKYLSDKAFDEGWITPITPLIELSTSVGIIGSGPAALAAADRLRSNGHQVHIYERSDRAGGLLIYGIPGFKLEKSVVQKRIDRLIQSGVQFHLNHEIGQTLSFDELKGRHDAVLIATGVYKSRSLGVPQPVFAEGKGTIGALDYLTHANRVDLGDYLDMGMTKSLNAKGQRVIVIGGGDTAMDCVRTAVRQGAVSVTCLYRRDRANMPGSAREVSHAEEEGVIFEWLSAPKALLGDEHKITSVRVQSMRLVKNDLTNRSGIEAIEGHERDLSADMVIEALGFEPEDLPSLFGVPNLVLSRHGTIKVNPKTFETSIKGVYAAGDIVRGASLVVWAVREGQDCAAQIHQALSQGQLSPKPIETSH